MIHMGAGERIPAFERATVEPNARIILAIAEALMFEPMQLLLLPNGVDLEALRLASDQSPTEMTLSAYVSRRSYVRWETSCSLPLMDDRIRSALTRSLGCYTDQIGRALQNIAGCTDPQN